MLIHESQIIASGSHLFAGFLFAVLSVPLLKRSAGDTYIKISLIIYSLCVVTLFTASGLYHGAPYESTTRAVLRQIDYGAIWLLMAGTFTACHAMVFRGWWRHGFLKLVWGIAIAGMIIKAIYLHEIPRGVSLALFLSLGFLGFISTGRYISRFGIKNTELLWAGGFLFIAAGILNWLRIPEISPGWFGFHEFFHFMVVFAALLHWKFIADRALGLDPIYD